MNGYELSRNWFDWCFENPEKISPNHSALYFFAIEHCNRLGWRKKFGFPTEMAKDAIGIKSYTTYIKTLNDLVDFGFIEMIERSKNQYSSNIVALTNFDKALDKALDKAIVKHVVKHSESTCESNVTIDKPLTKELLTNEQIDNTPLAVKFSFLKSLLELGIPEHIAKDWLQVRKTKKLSNTETAFKNLLTEFDKKQGKSPHEIIEHCVIKSWGGFSAKWEWEETNKNNNLKTVQDEQLTEIARLARSGALGKKR